MKRFIAVLSGLLIMPAFAEVAPVYYDEAIEYTDDYIDGEDVMVPDMVEDIMVEDVQPAATVAAPTPVTTVSPRNTTTRNAISRVAPASNSVGTQQRGTTQRPISSRTAASQTRNTTSRSAGQNAAASRATAGQKSAASVTTRREAPATNTTAARAGSVPLVQTNTVSSPIYTGRVGVRPTSSAGVRAPTVRVATSGGTSSSTSTSSGPSMDDLAQVTDFCKAQYTQCMDNFCSILDDNQGRCSCSVNIKNYSKTEEGLKNATAELQEVAQKIQYIGLTKDEVETLFNQTEAEAAMQGKTDTTQLKTDLDKVKNMIFDVRSANPTTTDTGMSMDLGGLLDFSFDNSGFDLGTLFGNNSTNTSISNQRGEDLYKTATARCKSSVLDSCKAQGVDTTIITNGYDLEIDKQCIVYERSLTDANSQMTQTVRNAKSVLQKARLVVAQQKNAYDLRGCINALDTCMQDEFVCGSDYENCLDPSGKYIVNGAVVIGSAPGVSGGTLNTKTPGKENQYVVGMYSVWNYTSPATGTPASEKTAAWSTGNVGDFIAATINSDSTTDQTMTWSTTNMVGYLQQKIGYNKGGKNIGMCMSVLNKCQDVTYPVTSGTATYSPDNAAVKGYLQRTLIQLKAGQDEVLAKYAESCPSDVASCLATNGYKKSTDVTDNTLAEAACKALITTCESVTDMTSGTIADYVASTK